MQTVNVNPPVTVTGRHFSVTPALNEYATRKVESLHLDYPRIIEAHVILEIDKYRHKAEIVLTCCHHITIEASEESHDLYASLDGVISKVARRMRKYKTRLLRTQRPHRSTQVRVVQEQVLPADVFAAFDALDAHMEFLSGGRRALVPGPDGAFPGSGGENGDGDDRLPGRNGHLPAPAADRGTLGARTSAVPAGSAPGQTDHHPSAGPLGPLSAAAAQEASRTAVKTETYPLKPIFVDEALLQLEMSNRQFLVFFNAQTEQVNVLYRRERGDFGLIQPLLA